MIRSTKSKIVAVAAAGALGVTLLGVAAHARGLRDRGPSPDRAAARLAEKLSLNDQQRNEVEKVLRASFEKRQAAREAQRAAMEALRTETEGELSKVLTPDQMARLRELRDDRAERRHGCDDRWERRRGCDGPRGRPCDGGAGAAKP